MEIRDMRFFCLTAELEHVSKAAEKLGVSQPFLTKIIGQLEAELGTSLFDNVGRGIRLNHYGKTLYLMAKKILGDVDSLYEKMDELLERHERLINFISDTAGYTSNIMLEYKKAYPQNVMSITYGKRDEIIIALTTGEADFALCTPPLTENDSKSIETEVVYEDCGCVLLPPEHPFIGRKSVDLNDLKGQSLVTSPLGAGVRNNLELIFKKHSYVPKIVCESNDMELLIRAVRGGLGFAVMPHWFLNDPELKQSCVELDVSAACAKIGLSYNSNSFSGKSADDFRQFIKKFFENM